MPHRCLDLNLRVKLNAYFFHTLFPHTLYVYVCVCVFGGCMWVFWGESRNSQSPVRVVFYGLRGLSIGVLVFILYKKKHLNLALTGDCEFLLSPKKTHSV